MDLGVSNAILGSGASETEQIQCHPLAIMKTPTLSALLLLVLAATTQAFISDEIVDNQFEKVHGDGSRIAGGTVVDGRGSSFPFELYIRPRRATVTVDRLQPPTCSGVLISDNAATNPQYWALTSARCALAGDTVEVYAGIVRSRDITAATTRQEIVPASSIIVHENFLRDMQDYDLAILPLVSTNTATRIEANGDSIQAARLPTISLTTNSFLASRVTMAGWGYPNQSFKSNAPTLRQVSTRVAPNFVCSMAHIGKSIKDTHICTNGLINRGPCTGDAGAPLILSSGANQGTLIGLATYTPQNGCQRSWPGVFTRITSHLDWIITMTGINPDDVQP